MSGRLVIVALTLLMIAGPQLFGGTFPAAAQSEPATGADVRALKSEMERVKSEMEGIRGELRLIRELLLQRQAQPPQAPPSQAPPSQAPPQARAKVGYADAPALGKKDAPVTLVEFSDYQCPFCKRFSETTLTLLKKEYIDTGKVRYVFRDFPIDGIHPQARKAAEAARCAGDQGKYWPMHDLLFEHQREFAVEKFKELAKRLGLDSAAFDDCLEKGRHASAVQKDYEAGVTAGVRGTPAFVVGKTGPGDAVEGVMISGARPLVDFRREIDRLLGGK